MASAMLFQSGLEYGFWGEAIAYASHVKNIIPRANESATPFKMWWGTKPKVTRFHPFGCEVFIHIPKVNRKKFQPKGERRILLGFADNYEAYRIFMIDS